MVEEYAPGRGGTGLFRSTYTPYSWCWHLQEIYDIEVRDKSRLPDHLLRSSTLVLPKERWEDLRAAHLDGHVPVDPLRLPQGLPGPAMHDWKLTYKLLSDAHLEDGDKGDVYPMQVDDLKDYVEASGVDMDVEDYYWDEDDFYVKITAVGSKRKGEKVLRSWVRKDPLRPRLSLDE